MAHEVRSAKVDRNQSLILTNPVADSSIVSRKRTFTLAQLRSDFRDAITQFVVLLLQLHDEKFTGQLILNFTQGRVCNVETVESQKIEP